MAEPFIAQVDLFGFNFVPQNWAQCAGELISISTNQAMFSLLGTAFGGDGRTTFALPDLRGKLAVSMGHGPGSQYDYNVGNNRGSETHTMSLAQLSGHIHTGLFTATGGGGTPTVTVEGTTDDGTSASPSDGAYLSTTVPGGAGVDKPEKIYKTNPTAGSTFNLGGVTTTGGGITGGLVTVNSTGSNKAFNIIEPSLVLNYCIATQGLFPSRN